MLKAGPEMHSTTQIQIITLEQDVLLARLCSQAVSPLQGCEVTQSANFGPSQGSRASMHVSFSWCMALNSDPELSQQLL